MHQDIEFYEVLNFSGNNVILWYRDNITEWGELSISWIGAASTQAPKIHNYKYITTFLSHNLYCTYIKIYRDHTISGVLYSSRGLKKSPPLLLKTFWMKFQNLWKNSLSPDGWENLKKIGGVPYTPLFNYQSMAIYKWKIWIYIIVIKKALIWVNK